jgi:hypothetical protein
MEMKDRVPKYPGRMKMTRSDGTEEYVTLERADEPEVEGTPLNTLNLLPDEIGKLFNLTEDDSVSNALYEAQNFAQWYFWALTAETNTPLSVGTASSTPYEASSSSRTVYYSSAYTLSNDGVYTLTNPTAITITSSNISSQSEKLKGKYFIPYASYGSSVYYMDESTTFGIGVSSSGTYLNTTPSLKVYSGVYTTLEKTIVWGHKRDAYTDGTNCEYLGTLAETAHTAIGSYVGTGTYGSGNKCSVTLDFIPSLFVVLEKKKSPSTGPGIVFFVRGMENGGYWKLSGTTLSWWDTSTASYQCNSSNQVYVWVAIN